VSSTAVTLSFARDAREQPSKALALACGVFLSWAVMFARVLVLVAIVNRALLAPLFMPFAVMAGVVGAIAAFHYVRARPADDAAGRSDLAVKNPFSLTERRRNSGHCSPSCCSR
jgi:uncharacterized membrane protein (DUF4010 family)